jgi:hypothetical protein
MYGYSVLSLTVIINSVVGGKAAVKLWLGRRPRTRPVAMNPVDHPMVVEKVSLLEVTQDHVMVYR